MADRFYKNILVFFMIHFFAVGWLCVRVCCACCVLWEWQLSSLYVCGEIVNVSAFVSHIQISHSTFEFSVFLFVSNDIHDIYTTTSKDRKKNFTDLCIPNKSATKTTQKRVHFTEKVYFFRSVFLLLCVLVYFNWFSFNWF